MSYTKQTWATGDTVTATKLNHMEDGIEGAGGGGYDLVIVAETTDDDLVNIPASDYRIVSGSIEACEQKVANMQPVNVYLGFYWVYGDTETPNILLLPENKFGSFDVAYKIINFGARPNITYTDNYEIDEIVWD